MPGKSLCGLSATYNPIYHHCAVMLPSHWLSVPPQVRCASPRSRRLLRDAMCPNFATFANSPRATSACTIDLACCLCARVMLYRLSICCGVTDCSLGF